MPDFSPGTRRWRSGWPTCARTSMMQSSSPRCAGRGLNTAAAWRSDEPAPVIAPQIQRAAMWRAARFGLSEGLLDPRSRVVVPAAVTVTALVDLVTPALTEAGDADLVADGAGAAPRRRDRGRAPAGRVPRRRGRSDRRRRRSRSQTHAGLRRGRQHTALWSPAPWGQPAPHWSPTLGYRLRTGRIEGVLVPTAKPTTSTTRCANSCAGAAWTNAPAPARNPGADRGSDHPLRGAGTEFVAAAAARPDRARSGTSSTRSPDSVRCSRSSTTPTSRRSGSTSPAGCSSPGVAARS